MNNTSNSLVSGIDPASFSAVTGPSQDLFRFVNGPWVDMYRLPDDRSRYGSFDKLAEDAENQIRDILEEDDCPAVKSRALYHSFLDVDAIDAAGLAAIEDQLASIDEAEDKAALTRALNSYGKKSGILKEGDSISGEDSREGLTAVISVKLTDAQFEGQTKTKLGNSEAKTFVQRVMTDKLGDWFDAHPNEAKNIIQKAIEASRARLAAKKARENTRRKSIFESAGMPDKLKDCQSNNPEECELFIVEGDSAGGSAIQGRNPITQAILPLRGKILNTERASLDRMMKSDTIESLITAVGGGYGEDFDLNKVRYHKVIIMADADVDGAHIATLNLTLFFRYMRPMITAGYVYVAMPPLYRLKWTKGPHDFVYTDAERDRVLAEGKAAGRQLPKGEGIQRYKGLGEMSYQELWETTMDPDHRILKQVQIEDAAAADETFSMLMGDEVEPRRLFIQRNARNVSWIDA